MAFYYPTRDRQQIRLTARGLLAETYELPGGATAAATLGATGASSTLNGGMVGLRAGDVVTNIVMLNAAVGADVTLLKYGLFTKAGVFLAATADIKASLATNAYVVGALSSPYTITADDGYYLCALSLATTTQPSFHRSTVQTGAGKQIGSGARAGMSVASQSDITGDVTVANGDVGFWFGCS